MQLIVLYRQLIDLKTHQVPIAAPTLPAAAITAGGPATVPIRTVKNEPLDRHVIAAENLKGGAIGVIRFNRDGLALSALDRDPTGTRPIIDRDGADAIDAPVNREGIPRLEALNPRRDVRQGRGLAVRQSLVATRSRGPAAHMVGGGPNGFGAGKEQEGCGGDEEYRRDDENRVFHINIILLIHHAC